MTLKSYFFIGLLITSIILGALFYGTYTNLKSTKKQLCDAQSNIITLQKENEKLTLYMKQKEKELAELQQKYKERLKDIPADQCGDAYPSKELLEFFKQGEIR